MMVIENIICHSKDCEFVQIIYKKFYNITNLIILVFEKTPNLSNDNLFFGINQILNELKLSMD